MSPASPASRQGAVLTLGRVAAAAVASVLRLRWLSCAFGRTWRGGIGCSTTLELAKVVRRVQGPKLMRDSAASYCACPTAQGDVLLALMEVADEELRKPAKAINRTRLQSLMEMGA